MIWKIINCWVWHLKIFQYLSDWIVPTSFWFKDGSITSTQQWRPKAKPLFSSLCFSRTYQEAHECFHGLVQRPKTQNGPRKPKNAQFRNIQTTWIWVESVDWSWKETLHWRGQKVESPSYEGTSWLQIPASTEAQTIKCERRCKERDNQILFSIALDAPWIWPLHLFSSYGQKYFDLTLSSTWF